MTLGPPKEAAQRIIRGQGILPTDAAQVAGAYLLMLGDMERAA